MGERRDQDLRIQDLRIGQIGALMANALTKKGAKRHSPEDFVFSVPKKKRRRVRPEDMLAAFCQATGSEPPGFSPPSEDPSP